MSQRLGDYVCTNLNVWCYWWVFVSKDISDKHGEDSEFSEGFWNIGNILVSIVNKIIREIKKMGKDIIKKWYTNHTKRETKKWRLLEGYSFKTTIEYIKTGIQVMTKNRTNHRVSMTIQIKKLNFKNRMSRNVLRKKIKVIEILIKWIMWSSK